MRSKGRCLFAVHLRRQHPLQAVIDSFGQPWGEVLGDFLAERLGNRADHLAGEFVGDAEQTLLRFFFAEFLGRACKDRAGQAFGRRFDFFEGNELGELFAVFRLVERFESSLNTGGRGLSREAFYTARDSDRGGEAGDRDCRPPRAPSSPLFPAKHPSTVAGEGVEGRIIGFAGAYGSALRPFLIWFGFWSQRHKKLQLHIFVGCVTL